MIQGDLPLMSLILSTPGTLDELSVVLAHLRGQSAAAKMEVVVVTSRCREVERQGGRLTDFWGYRMVKMPERLNSASIQAAGIRVARGPIITLCEEHAFPQPGWAEALIRAHQGPWAAVGPLVLNANPRSTTSQAGYLMSYGQWAPPAAGGEVTDLPGNNSSYKREVLLAYGDRLELMLCAHTVMHWDLRARGHRLYLEPEARMAHLNISCRWALLLEQLMCGRRFAALRSQDWGVLRRLLFVLAWPAIPWRRLASIAKLLFQGPGLPALPMLLAALHASAWGEMQGCLTGLGKVDKKLLRFEMNRRDMLDTRDRAALNRP